MQKFIVTKKPFKGKPVGTEIELNERQGRLLTKLGRAQYMTRDIVAAPAQAVAQAAPVFVPAAASPEAPAAVDDLDSSGAAWDERLHASSKVKNADGTWRKRPGAKPAESADE